MLRASASGAGERRRYRAVDSPGGVMRLTGNVAIVTGSAAGIGRGIALHLAEEGADVVVADIDEKGARGTAAKIEALGRRALAVVADVSRLADVAAMVAKARELGHVSILVNNAGIERMSALFDVSEDEWDSVLSVNLTGTFLCCQAIAKSMVAEGRGGKIVNLGSIAGFSLPRRESHYGVSKAGVHALTRQLALDLAPHRINVNAVAPGVIANGMSTRDSLSDPDRAERLRQRIPWGRFGTPRDVGHAVVFLTSSEADYITGTVLIVDGGFLMGP